MKRSVSLIVAVSIVLTNMIGTGILTTPGILSSYLPNSGQVMLVWILGGLMKRIALNFQLILTFSLIAFLILISIWGISYPSGNFAGHHSLSSSGIGNNFGMALLISVYSYTGWNASCYFAGEICHPKRNLPLSLFLGVLLVMLLYLAVNYGLMRVLGVKQLSGRVDFLAEVGNRLSGKAGSQIVSITVLIILLASISSMIFTAFGIFLFPWKRLKVSNIQEVMVKASAAILMPVLCWLIVNSMLEIKDYKFFTLTNAILFFSGITILMIFKNRIANTNHCDPEINFSKSKINQ